MGRDIAIVLLTAHRLNYASEALASTLDMVLTVEQPIHVHIASDGDDAEYINALIAVAQSAQIPGDFITHSNSGKRGYGANYNEAMNTLWNDPRIGYLLPLEDDWYLRRALNLSALSAVLDDESLGVGCIRMGYLGWTQELRGRMIYNQPTGQHLLYLDPDSNEPHVFSGHPRLETVAWSKQLGPWPEGMNPGETEFTVAHFPNARRGVAWPMDIVKPLGDLFTHEGTVRSY